MKAKKLLWPAALAIAALLTIFTAPASASTVYTNDSSAAVSYSAGWSAQSSADTANYYYYPSPWGAYNDDFHISSTANSTATFTFTGSSITVLGVCADNLGMVDIVIDGGAAVTEDLFLPKYDDGVKKVVHKRAIFQKNDLTDGPHTITVRVKGQKNPASTGYGVILDAFEVRTKNLAKNTAVSYSSSVGGYGWFGSRAADGEKNTIPSSMGWSSNGNLTADHTEWISMDLGETNYIDRIDLYPRNDAGSVGEYFPVNFDIQLSSDNTNWVTVVSRTNYPKPGNAVQSFRIAAQTARYVRVHATSLRQNAAEYNYYRMQLAEIEVCYDEYKHTATNTAAAGAAYYVSSSSGNDNNDGRSTSTPWKTLTKASTMTYSSGNRILLKAGDTWTNETLFLHGNGTSANPILVSSYSSGNKPVINAGKGAAHGIKISDAHGYKISGLEFTGSVTGILVVSDKSYGHDYLWIENCNFHDIEGSSIGTENVMPYPETYFGSAIAIASWLDDATRNNTCYSNVTITNCTMNQCDTGIITLIRDKAMRLNGFPTNGWYFNRNAISNLNINNCTITRSYRSGGIMLYGISGGTTENVLIDETAYLKGMYWGTAAFQIADSQNYLIKNSEFKRTMRTNDSPDGEGIDIEAGNINVTVQNCYIHDNEGAGIMFYGQNGGWNKQNRDITVDGCFFYSNGTQGAGYDAKAIKNYPDNTGIVKNCLFKLKFAGQECSSAPLTFDATNYIFNPDYSQVFGPGRTIHSLGAAVTASSDVNGYGWNMNYAKDGITSSIASASYLGWSSNNSLTTNHTEYMVLDMGSARYIGEVDLYAVDREMGVYFPKDFTISVSTDGVNYTPVVTRTNYAQPVAAKQTFTFTPQYARYVKLECTSLRQNPNEYNYYRVQLAEIVILQLY